MNPLSERCELRSSTSKDKMCRGFYGKTQIERLFEESVKMMNNIKMETWWESVDWINLAQNGKK